MNKQIKNATSVVLAFAMGISLCGANITKGTETKTNEKTVFSEIEKTDITKDKLENIADIALKDGEKAAKIVNSYENTVDYDAALNYALTSYYETENFKQLDSFEDAVDNRGEEIVEGYEAAAEERKKGDDNGYETGTVIAIFDENATEEEINAVCKAQYGEVESIYKDFTGDYVAEISISLGQTVDMASEAYREYSITETVDNNAYYDIAESTVGATSDPDIEKQYYLDTIHAKEAWDYVSSHNHDKLLVGVIDTGVQVDHPDIKNILSPYSVDITKDTPVLLTECDEPYKTNHGTGVSSIIAAEANNGMHMAGVASCYNNDVVEILAIQASTYDTTNKDYRFSTSNLIKAMNYCAEHGTKVVNMSLGGYNHNSAEENSLNKLTNEGIIVVCAAGNDHTDTPHYPSDYDKAIGVSSTTSSNILSQFSNYGNQKNICAPGSSIHMLNTNSGTFNASGTSLASPVVAAVAAMMCSLNNDLNYFDVKRIMANTATDLANEDSRNKVPFGIVNAAKCVEYAVSYTPDTLFKFETEVYQNLAYKKNVTASSTYSADTFPLSNLVDGDISTKCITEQSNGQWVEVDLGQAYEIDKINLCYERFSTTGYRLMISENHEDWTEVASGEKATQITKTFEFAKQKARYVKAEFVDNATYVILTELEVYGYVEPKTEYKDILNEVEKPSEVLNMTARWAYPSGAVVAWKEDNNRISKGYIYNLYVDGKLYQSGIKATAYPISGLATGNHTFKVTACLNGYESAGTTISTYVGGSMPQTTTQAPTTVPETTTIEEVSTTEEVPTTEEQTTVPVNGPLEVIGLIVNCTADNTIGVVWGQDADRMNSGCKYNVYVNGEKKLSEVICAYYNIENVTAGTVTVKVTSVLNGIESSGAIQTVEVSGVN